MQDLNSRFANYIEKNRFLEAQLKSVEQRLKDLQNKWGEIIMYVSIAPNSEKLVKQ